MLSIVFPTNKATDTPDATLLNSVLHNKGGVMSPISQLDIVRSQVDRHDPTWTICPQFPPNRRHLCSLSRAGLLNAAVFCGRHPGILLCFLQCRHHTIPTKWPPHHPYKVTAALYTLVAAYKKPSHSTVLVSGKGHCGLCLFWAFHRLEPVLLYFYSFYSGPEVKWEVVFVFIY